MSDNINLKKTTKSPCVYIMKCSDGTLYTGWTNDMKKRLSSHNCGRGAKYTRSRLPVTPVYVEFLQSRSDALTRARKLELISSACNQLFMLIDDI